MGSLLSVAEIAQLQEALLQSLNRGEFKQAVYFALEESMEDIVDSGPFREQVHAVVVWANKREGKIDKLLKEARKINSSNPLLQQFAEQYARHGQPRPVAEDVQPQIEPPSAVEVEALIFGLQRDTRLPFSFLEGAQRVAMGVAHLTVPRIFNGTGRGGEVMFGTGWLVAPGLVMTNHHVIAARGYGEAPVVPADLHAQAEAVEVRFSYFEAEDSRVVSCYKARLLASDSSLDFALIELAEANKVADRQILPVVANPLALSRGDRLNIVQHPQGGPLRLAIRNNFYVQPGSANFIRYQTDTEPGASGSPVCDDAWQVVALHHASVKVPPVRPPQETDGNPVTVKVLNEAVTIHAVLNTLPSDIRQRIATAQGWV
jgi:V8-like Glu-specific endopeptidase